MFRAFRQFFNSIFAVFSALEKAALTIDEGADIALQETKGLSKVMEVDREDRLKRRIAELKAAMASE